jgi:DNA-directed RNA polymerase subunit alpha
MQNKKTKGEKNQHKITLPFFAFHDRLAKLKKNKKRNSIEIYSY